MRHPAVLTDFVPLIWHDLARHIARRCGSKISANVRLALDMTLAPVVYRRYELTFRISRKLMFSYDSKGYAKYADVACCLQAAIKNSKVLRFTLYANRLLVA